MVQYSRRTMAAVREIELAQAQGIEIIPAVMPQTIITVRRPDGTVEEVRRDGTILDAAMRRQMTEATRNAGKGDIIGWQVIEGQPVRPARRPRIGCPSYVYGQGCPQHGESCADGR